jgi:hypothetical protein
MLESGLAAERARINAEAIADMGRGSVDSEEMK